MSNSPSWYNGAIKAFLRNYAGNSQENSQEKETAGLGTATTATRERTHIKGPFQLHLSQWHSTYAFYYQYLVNCLAYSPRRDPETTNISINQGPRHMGVPCSEG
jgi:hypothetical protein